MARLRLEVAWSEAPEEEAFGPELPTWGNLTITVDGRPLTRNLPVRPFSSGALPEADHVSGPMSGIAEWFVDHLAEILWEFPVPFPKLDEHDRSGVPGTGQATRFWRDLRDADDEVDVVDLARWQRRHTVGIAASQLAVPSLVLVPEPNRIGLFVDSLVDSVDPSVRVLMGSEREFWLDRADLRAEVSQFVDGVIARAEATSDGSAWAKWLSARWIQAKERETDPEVKRVLEFGRVAAGLWQRRLRDNAVRPAVEGLLFDVRAPQSDDDVECLLSAVSASSPRPRESTWRTLRNGSETIGGSRPAHQGYRMARKVRKYLGLGDGPIERTDIVLNNLDVNDGAVESRHLFRSVAVVRDQHAWIGVASENNGHAFTRVARAAALGRLLFDSSGPTWGAAVGTHSRWVETRRANAFAAELLAPASAVRERYMHDPEGLAADYGISASAARWRIHNSNSADWA